VVNVRPDAGASLVYRVHLPIPRWVAPGTYALRLGAPGLASRVRVAAVRVLEPGASPRVALLGALDPAPPSAGSALGPPELRERLAQAEVDLWIARDAPGIRARLLARTRAQQAPALLLLPSPPSASPPPSALLLRLGAREMLSIGGCDDPSGAFEDRRRALLRREGRALASLRPWPPAGHWTRLDERRPRPLDELGSARLERAGGRARALASGGALPRLLRLMVPEDGRATQVEGAEVLGWWPAAPLWAQGGRPALVALLRLEAGGEARIARPLAPPLALGLEAPAEGLLAGALVSLRAAPSRDARVHWQTEGGQTGIGPVLPYRGATLEPVEVQALAIDAEGVPARAGLLLRAETDAGPGCSLIAPTGLAGSTDVGFLLVGLLAWTITRRRPILRES
ncbi:MAG: hypothetical protein OEY14_08975, partial [Myxococcales bacterium]|nr:hypothetical protein [Myxococcales bacterium]